MPVWLRQYTNSLWTNKGVLGGIDSCPMKSTLTVRFRL